MKTIITTLLLAISIMGFSQNKMTKEQQKKMKQGKEMMQNMGSLTFEVNGKKETIQVSLIKGKEYYSIMTFSQKMDGNRILLHFKKFTSGTQEFNLQEPGASGYISSTKAYEIRGSITLKMSGDKVSGSFTGELIDIVKRESFKKKADKIDANAKAGKITGTFSNLKLITKFNNN